MLFQDAAIDSAQQYYQYLEETGGGLVKANVVRIEKDEDCYVLHLKSRVAFSDDTFIRIHNQDYSREQILPIEYDEMRRLLRIRPKAAFCKELDNIQPYDIAVVSDLRFLVKRVEEWYKLHGTLPQIPYQTPTVAPNAFPSLLHQPSHEQNVAIEGALSSPFSYVWGAPGTGKTRFVLARCILTYILAGKQILITAPTNNAVEQMLYGVLAVLEEAGIPVDRVLRLGLASSEFISRYPKVCEDIAHDKRISAIQEQIKADHRQLAEVDKLISMFPERERLHAKAARFQECYESLLQLFDHMNALRQQIKECKDAHTVLIGNRTLLADQLKTRKAEHGRIVQNVRQLTQNVDKYSHGIRKFLGSKKHTKFLADLQIAIADEKQLQAEIDGISQRLQTIQQEQQKLDDSIATKQEEIKEHQTRIRTLTVFWPELHALAIQAMTREDVSKEYQEMTELLQSTSGKIERLQQSYQTLESTSEQDLMAQKQRLTHELISHQEQLAQAEAQSTFTRIKTCSVLAATVDRCIKDLSPSGEFKPAHVFLDEAGYCSLIKAVTLMAYDCPLTFLGDHMQLPPVCEMDKKQMKGENASVTLWAQSALYAEDALTLAVEQVYEDYQKHSTARFQKMRKFNLTHTYRFGESLAQVLASDVYTEGFFGDPNHDTEIYFIPVSRVPNGKKRSNAEECHAIVEYCRENNDQSVGIITPYTAQRDCLRRALGFSSSLSDSVMTVHGSQGREWDVVFFSVVDTSDKWFTDSHNTNSNGKQVINTAVSRAKKKLILVCDADYWKTQHQQLIGKLLKVAAEI